MAVVIGVLTFAAILAVIAVTMLIAIAALVEILPPLSARDGEPAAGQTSGSRPQSRDDERDARARVRLIH